MSKLLGVGESKVPKLAPQRTVISWRKVKFFYFGLRVPPRCTASLWVASLGTRIQCGGTLSPLPTGRDSLAEFYYLGLMPPRCTASLWVASLGTRIQCGGTSSPLPTGRSLPVGIPSPRPYRSLPYGRAYSAEALPARCLPVGAYHHLLYSAV